MQLRLAGVTYLPARFAHRNASFLATGAEPASQYPEDYLAKALKTYSITPRTAPLGGSFFAVADELPWV
jgi:hypothetical protein